MKKKLTPYRWFSALGRKTRIFLLSLLVLAVAVALFDWNWLRGPLVNYVAKKSGREVRVDDLHISLGLNLQPTMRLRGVYVENAQWASRQPMTVAGEVSFTFSLDSLWERRPIVARLVLIDAEVDMERRADGSRNWRLVDPEYLGPGRIRVRTLEAHRSRIRFLNGEAGLDMTVQATPADDTLPTKLVIKGKFQGVPFDAAGFSGNVVSFRDSDLTFPLRGHLTAGKSRIDVDGTFTDIFDMGPMNAQVRVAGPTLSRMHPFLKLRPPVTRPYALEAQIKQDDKTYTFAQLRGKVGESDFAGEATYDRNTQPPTAKLDLRSESADLADVVFLAGRDYQPGGSIFGTANADRPERKNAPAAGKDPGESERLFSARPVRTERLRKADAHLKLELKKLRASAMPMLESLRLAADLVDGVLKVTAIDLGVAGGHVTGSLAYDGKVGRASLDARNVRLERLLPPLKSTSAAPGTGAVRAQLRMTGQGDSAAGVLASSTGTFAALVEGGRISNLVDAKLGLNMGKALGLKIRGDREIALNCGAAAFKFSKGVGKSQIVLLETEQTHTDGTGTINLRDQNFDLLLTPQPKNPGLFTLNSSLHVQGSFKTAGYKVEDRVPLARGGASGPQAAAANLLRPLLEAGPASGQCAAVLGMRAAPAKTAASRK